jgi:hypothetical protein
MLTDSNKLATMITRYEVVEVVINATTVVGQVSLPPSIQNLQNTPERKIFIKDIEVFPVYAQAASVKQSGVPGMPVAEIPKISLSIYYDNGVFIRYIPLAKLIYTQMPGVLSPFQVERVAFDMLYPVAIDQCFLQFNTAPVGMPYIVPIGFTYTYMPVVKANA